MIKILLELSEVFIFTICCINCILVISIYNNQDYIWEKACLRLPSIESKLFRTDAIMGPQLLIRCFFSLVKQLFNKNKNTLQHIKEYKRILMADGWLRKRGQSNTFEKYNFRKTNPKLFQFLHMSVCVCVRLWYSLYPICWVQLHYGLVSTQ